MKVQYLNSPKGIRKIMGLCLMGALTGATFVQQSLAQAPASQYQSLIFADPLKQINWISGPQDVGIGNIADVTIPDGYRFADAHGARVILENSGASVPDDLAGVLINSAGTWWAVVEFSPNGYVRSDDLANIDSSAILAAVKKELQNQDSGITSLNWESKPVFDAQTHALSWSLQAQSASGKSLNEGVALLGRNGVLQITAVRKYPLGNAPSLAELVSKNIGFKIGERYGDYQKGDKLGDIGLASLIAGVNDESRASATGTAAWVYWVYSSFAVCAAFGGVMFLVKRKKSRRRVRRHGHVSAPAAASLAPAATVPAAATLAATAEPSVAATNGKLNGNSQPKTATVGANGTNGTNGTRHLHRNRRKKVFDYPKFYTNVMRELSFHAYESSPLVLNGKGRNGYGNGHTNGHTNGTNGHANGVNGTNGNGTNGSGVNDTVKSGIEELIATQKALIQEQKCLLEQQTKLIEEKRWLIEEQTAFLKGQAGMMSDGQPLKFE